MTTVAQIIMDAFRQSNLVATGMSPTAPEVTEALRYLNRIIKSVFGNEAGEDLVAFPIGNNNIVRPAGYPRWTDVPDTDWYVPKNTRAILNLNNSVSLYLHPDPGPGSRFAAIDVLNSLDSTNVTVYGNGSLIEGMDSIILDVAGTNVEWFYREDLANWVRYSPLEEASQFPFPEEFDDFFITMLATRLNPSYGVSLDPQSAEFLRRSTRQIKARYKQNKPTHSEMALLRMSRMGGERRYWSNYDNYYTMNPNALFDRG